MVRCSECLQRIEIEGVKLYKHLNPGDNTHYYELDITCEKCGSMEHFRPRLAGALKNEYRT